METRRLTRSQAAQLGLTPTKEVFLESARKPSARKSTRKALVDRTNEKDDSPVSGLASMASKGVTRSVYEHTPLSKLRSLSETGPQTPGEDVLRTQVQSLLSEGSEDVSSPDIQSLFRGGLSTLAPVLASSILTLNVQPQQSLLCEGSEDVSSPDIQSLFRGGLSTLAPVQAPSILSLKVQPQQLTMPAPVVVREPVSPCIENRQSEDVVDLPLDFSYAKSPRSPRSSISLATVEEESESCITESEEDFKEVNSQQEPSASKITDVAPRISIPKVLSATLFQPSDYVGRVAESMETQDQDLHESLSDEASESSEVVNARQQDACQDDVCSQVLPAQWQQRRSPQKVKFQEDHVGDSDAYDDYEDCGEESLEYESGHLTTECDDLCRGLSGISMHERDGVRLPEFSGIHIRFNYNSDDEMEDELLNKEVVRPETPKQTPVMTALMRFKGLPTPKGKHLRFTQDIDSPSD